MHSPPLSWGRNFENLRGGLSAVCDNRVMVVYEKPLIRSSDPIIDIDGVLRWEISDGFWTIPPQIQTCSENGPVTVMCEKLSGAVVQLTRDSEDWRYMYTVAGKLSVSPGLEDTYYARLGCRIRLLLEGDDEGLEPEDKECRRKLEELGVRLAW